ncbi:MAG TPA: hypothetical protein DCP90_07885 [Clostridiales bacterium]|nr:MAG: hypothetical protein A2Y22_06080 [Clostridiales bacterium GWD2_32_59]HAN10519.1 hypothetical protein [Clostridiales bacterium]
MKRVKLKEVATITLTPIINSTEEMGELKMLKPSAVDNGVINEEKLQWAVNDKKKDINGFFLKKDDLVFQAKGNKFEAVYIDKEYDKLISNQIYFNVIPNRESVNTEYLAWIMNNKESKKYFDINSSGATIKSVNKKVLEDLQIMLPSLKEQEQIVELLNAFKTEKENTIKYIDTKERLVEEIIYQRLRGEV